MPQFAANLTMMYTELPFLDRFAAASKDGFKSVEFLFPYEFPANVIAEKLRSNGLRQVLFNAPPGDWEAGDRGTAAMPHRIDEFRQAFRNKALLYAQALACPRIHVMSGLVSQGANRQTYVDNLAWAAPEAAALGIDLLIEPLNPRDVPNYLLSHQQQAHDIVQEIGAPNIKVQMDLYHCQIVEGDVSKRIRQFLATGQVGHFQIAGVPERHEPQVGELHYPYIFALLDELGWTHPIGCEYRPKSGTSAGLEWFLPFKDSQY